MELSAECPKDSQIVGREHSVTTLSRGNVLTKAIGDKMESTLGNTMSLYCLVMKST